VLQQDSAVAPPGAGTAGYPSALYPFYNPLLAPYDLSRGGTPYIFNGHTDVKELALYVRDSITKGNWALNLGPRAISTMASPPAGKRNLVSALLTMSKKPTRYSGFLMRERWNPHSTRT
jgi:hypothetical protein